MDKRIRTVITLAVHAPSGDNTQPWYFTIDGDRVRIHLIPDLDNPILNFRLSGTYVAHGALIESMVLAAAREGLGVSVRVLPDANDPLCTAEFTFSDTPATLDPLAAQLEARHTNRKPYEPRAVPDTVLASLRDAGGAGTVFLTDAAAIRSVAHASALMEQVALETPELRQLFFSDILWSDAENRAGKPGLYVLTMEVPPPARFLFRHLTKPAFANLLLRLGFSKAARATNAKLYATAPLLALISMREESPAAYLAVGRALERLWLAATAEGLAVQPVTGLSFLARSIEHDEASKLLPKHFAQICDAEHALRTAFSLTNEQIPGMMVRIGYAAPATARSFRHAPDIRQ
jgi:hypothetical protein